MGRLLNPKSSGSSSSSTKKPSTTTYNKPPASKPTTGQTLSEKYPKGIAKLTDGVLRYKDGSLGSAKSQAYFDWNYGRKGGDQDYRDLTASEEYQREYDRLSSLKPGDSVWGNSGSSSGGGRSSGSSKDAYSPYGSSASSAYDAYGLKAEAERARREQEEARRANYDSSAGMLGGQKRDALTEAYIRNQQAQQSFPQMAQLVGGGGASESAMMQLGAQYGNERSATEQAYMQALAGMESDYNSGLATDAAQYYDRVAGISEQQRQEQLAREQMAMQIAEAQKDRDFTESQTLAARAEARRIEEERLARQMGGYSGGSGSTRRLTPKSSGGGSSGGSYGGANLFPDNPATGTVDLTGASSSAVGSWTPSGIDAYVRSLIAQGYSDSEIEGIKKRNGWV